MTTELARLIEALDAFEGTIPLDALQRMLESTRITRADLEPHLVFCDECYQRNLVRETDTYHLYAMCWSGGQASPIHDHAGSACGLKVIDGEAFETIFEHTDAGRLRPHAACRKPAGHVCVSYDGDTHRFGNASRETCMISLHVYTPPLQGYQIFDDDLVESSETSRV